MSSISGLANRSHQLASVSVVNVGVSRASLVAGNALAQARTTLNVWQACMALNNGRATSPLQQIMRANHMPYVACKPLTQLETQFTAFLKSVTQGPFDLNDCNASEDIGILLEAYVVHLKKHDKASGDLALRAQVPTAAALTQRINEGVKRITDSIYRYGTYAGMSACGLAHDS